MPGEARIPEARANELIRTVASWVGEPDPEAVRAEAARWDPPAVAAFQRVVVMHGLAPHLASTIGASSRALLPDELMDWLARQQEMNARRIARLHDDLAAILAAGARSGIELMPLKGALLTTLPGRVPARRPMADLDVLVRPHDRAAIRTMLERLGYRFEPLAARRPGPDSFLDPGGGRVVSVEAEHPDNPRRVEVHTDVKRHLWAWDDTDELTPALWRGATPGEVLGQPAVLPRPSAMYAHLAIHATSDLLVGRGRLVQWLDLAIESASSGPMSEVPHPRLAYPALRLAVRVLPRGLAAVDLGGLERRMPPELVRWAGAVAIDGHAGLITGPPPERDTSFRARWRRWRPMRWRLAVAYGALPLPVLLARHGLTLARRTRSFDQPEPRPASLA